MANKRQRQDLRKVESQSQEYWEEILGRGGLSMSRGKSTHLVYVGDSNVLDRIEGVVRTDDGSVAPKGEGPA